MPSPKGDVIFDHRHLNHESAGWELPTPGRLPEV